LAFFVGVGAALLTSFYSWRLVFLTFFGKPRWARASISSMPSTSDPPSRRARTHRGYHPHESPLSMLIPLFVLSIGAMRPAGLRA
jgi:NADH-quinone oxidoreductase subunit L